MQNLLIQLVKKIYRLKRKIYVLTLQRDIERQRERLDSNETDKAIAKDFNDKLYDIYGPDKRTDVINTIADKVAKDFTANPPLHKNCRTSNQPTFVNITYWPEFFRTNGKFLLSLTNKALQNLARKAQAPSELISISGPVLVYKHINGKAVISSFGVTLTRNGIIGLPERTQFTNAVHHHIIPKPDQMN
jgi:hypothetical protein